MAAASLVERGVGPKDAVSISYCFCLFSLLAPLPGAPGASDNGVRSVLRRFLASFLRKRKIKMQRKEKAARLPTTLPTTTGVDVVSVESDSDPTTPTAVSVGLEVSLAAVGSREIVVRMPPGKVAVVRVD